MQLIPDAALRERLVRLRRELHQDPELSFQETRTCERLFALLHELCPGRVERVAETGVIARIRGRQPGAPVVAVRGDIDALPIQEDTALDFASRNPGVMHACGHDVHATWAVGAAYLLAAQPALGDVLVLLQPGEETGLGARRVLDSGCLDEAAAVFGGHVDRRYPVGTVVAQAGPLAASADTFRIRLHGQGGHGARPHEAADAIVGAGALIGALQTIISRRLNPADPAVLSVGTLRAGSAPNVIPESAELTGTLRALEPGVRDTLVGEVRRIAESIAAVYRLRAEVEIDLGPPPLINSPEATAWAEQAVAEVLGRKALRPLESLNLGGEDFSYYLEGRPGCFLRIGACEPGGLPIPAHSSRFYVPDESIFVGAAVLAETARVASAALAA